MKVLVTGGHFSPAYSVIQELLAQHHEVVIAGRIHPFEGDKTSVSYEYTVSKELGIPFFELKTGRIQRKLTKHTLPALIRLPLGLSAAYRILSRTQPDLVVTFGGYLGVPIAMAAAAHRIPVVAHEQTQQLGLANAWIARFASIICVSFPESISYIKHANVILTGNPVRANIYNPEEAVSVPKGHPVVYITGGSTGSHAINEVIKEALPQLLTKYTLIHQTGDSQFHDFEELEKVKKSLPDAQQTRYIVQKFILPSQIGSVYQQAGIVVGRSGANTILELIALNKPSVMIPLPHGQSGEQLENAKLLEKLGLAEILLQTNLDRHSLVVAIDRVADNIQKYTIPATVQKQYIFPDAARRIVDVLTAQYEKKKKRA